MASYLSDQERRMYEEDLKAAEPYSDDEMSVVDCIRDPLRVKATFAKRILQMAYAKEAGK